MPTGPELIAAILQSNTLMDIDNCPGVPGKLSKAIYGTEQSDSGPGQTIRRDTIGQINNAIKFSGADSYTAVWHFLIVGSALPGGNPVHHIVVVPWKDESQEQCYTVFMAYEKKYKLKDYVNLINNAPKTAKGYKTSWTAGELSTMFNELLTSPAAWRDYFGEVMADNALLLAETISYWKYDLLALRTALDNVKKYR